MKNIFRTHRGEGILRNEAPRPKGRSFPVRRFLCIVPLDPTLKGGTCGALAGQKGLVLPLALIFLVILSIMGIAAIMTSTSTTALFGGLRRGDEALYYAEAGIEAAKNLLARDIPNLDSVYANSGQLDTLPGTITYGNGSYTVRIVNDEGETDPNVETNGIYIIRSTGRAYDATKTLEVVVLSFSRFFYFTEWEEAPLLASTLPWEDRFVFFRTGDDLDGPVHSNHALHIAGNPVFHDLASSSAVPFKLSGAAADSAIFLGGTNWSRTISLPVGDDDHFGTPDDLKTVLIGATAKGRIIDTFDTGTGRAWDYRVHFRGDRGSEIDIYKKDSQDCDPVNSRWTFVETLTISASFNGVVYFVGGGAIHVGGKIKTTGTATEIGKLQSSGTDSTVQGRWTICSAMTADINQINVVLPAGEIQVEGDIRYVGHYTGGAVFPDEDDPQHPIEGLLGLVSANNVVIKSNGEDTDNTIRDNGLTIHASIMATSNDNATFNVETTLLEQMPGSANLPLNLLGGVIQVRRGVVGVFDAAGLVYGFDKNYKYDRRLRYMSPPSFPLALNLRVRSWKE
jgi:hypothetical protein